MSPPHQKEVLHLSGASALSPFGCCLKRLWTSRNSRQHPPSLPGDGVSVGGRYWAEPVTSAV